MNPPYPVSESCRIAAFAALALAFVIFVPRAWTQTLSSTAVEISTLTPTSQQQGFGILGIDRSVGGAALKIGDRTFEHGLGTHAVSEVVYGLDESYSGFTAWVGLDAEMADHKLPTEAKVIFRVIADGVKVFDSGVMGLDSPAKQIDLNVRGVTELKLVATNGVTGVACDHADWADAKLWPANSSAPAAAAYQVRSAMLALGFTSDGKLAAAALSATASALSGGTKISGCVPAGPVAVAALPGGGVRFTHPLKNATGNQSLTLMESFTPTKDSIRWEIEIDAGGAPWSSDIISRLKFPVTPGTRFWTAWSDPEHRSDGWHDPLVLEALTSTDWSLSGVDQTQGTYISVPVATIANPADNTALSLIVSPESTLLDTHLATTTAGAISFTFKNHRIGEGKPVRLAMDLVKHEADWRGGLRWMVARYPQYFNSPNPRADQLAGCGAYSGDERPIDTELFKKMSFRINWKLSDDFPYMGMFIPPVTSAEEQWKRSCGEPAPPGKGPMISCRQMNDYAKWMRGAGFSVLNYFNVTEFGKNMGGKVNPAARADDPNLWKDPNAFLALRMPHATLEPKQCSCYNAWLMDCADPAYQNLILEQAQRHIQFLPDTDGICIDRLDWLRLYNLQANDGASWVNGAPARWLGNSWNNLLDRLGPLEHKANKVIFVNPIQAARLDLMREVDGFYSEFGHTGPGLNAMAFMAVRKPAIAWTEDSTWKSDPDGFFQRYLHLGAYPTAPYPYNNHCIVPSPQADALYIAYGPLMDAMRGKKWVLEPNCVTAPQGGATVNLFQVPGGYALPVTFAGNADSVNIEVRNIAGLTQLKCDALLPGGNGPLPVPATCSNGVLSLKVPMSRGCAMVRLRL